MLNQTVDQEQCIKCSRRLTCCLLHHAMMLSSATSDDGTCQSRPQRGKPPLPVNVQCFEDNILPNHNSRSSSYAFHHDLLRIATASKHIFVGDKTLFTNYYLDTKRSNAGSGRTTQNGCQAIQRLPDASSSQTLYQCSNDWTGGVLGGSNHNVNAEL